MGLFALCKHYREHANRIIYSGKTSKRPPHSTKGDVEDEKVGVWGGVVFRTRGGVGGRSECGRRWKSSSAGHGMVTGCTAGGGAWWLGLWLWCRARAPSKEPRSRAQP